MLAAPNTTRRYALRAIGGGGELRCQVAELHQGEFDEQARVSALLVGGFTAGRNAEGFEQETDRAALRHFLVTLGYGWGQFQQGTGCIVLADEQVAEMGAQPADETLGVESF